MSTEIIVQKLRGLATEIAGLTEEQPAEVVTKAIEQLAEVGRMLTARKRSNKYGTTDLRALIASMEPAREFGYVCEDCGAKIPDAEIDQYEGGACPQCGWKLDPGMDV